MKLYTFEGQELRLHEICKLAPVYGRSTIADALAEGCSSIADLHARDQRMRKRKSEGGRKGGKGWRRSSPHSAASERERGHYRKDLDGMGVAR